MAALNFLWRVHAEAAGDRRIQLTQAKEIFLGKIVNNYSFTTLFFLCIHVPSIHFVVVFSFFFKAAGTVRFLGTPKKKKQKNHQTESLSSSPTPSK